MMKHKRTHSKPQWFCSPLASRSLSICTWVPGTSTNLIPKPWRSEISCMGDKSISTDFDLVSKNQRERERGWLARNKLSKCGLATISPEIMTTNVLPLCPHIYGHASRNHATNFSFSLLKSLSLPLSSSISPLKWSKLHFMEKSASPRGKIDGGLSGGRRNRRIPVIGSSWKQGIRQGLVFLWRRDEV